MWTGWWIKLNNVVSKLFIKSFNVSRKLAINSRIVVYKCEQQQLVIGIFVVYS